MFGGRQGRNLKYAKKTQCSNFFNTWVTSIHLEVFLNNKYFNYKHLACWYKLQIPLFPCTCDYCHVLHVTNFIGLNYQLVIILPFYLISKQTQSSLPRSNNSSTEQPVPAHEKTLNRSRRESICKGPFFCKTVKHFDKKP